MIIYYHQNNISAFAGGHVYLSPVWISQIISKTSAAAPATPYTSLALMGVGV